MNRSVRTGAILFGIFGFALLLEFLWIQLGHAGLASAKQWADRHPADSQPPLVVGGLWFLGVAWSLARGHRWAWLVAVAWSSVCGVIGGIAVATTLLTHPDTAIEYAGNHSVEATLGMLSLGCLIGSLVSLVRAESRRYFRVGKVSGGLQP
jgi:hypothetical protein